MYFKSPWRSKGSCGGNAGRKSEVQAICIMASNRPQQRRDVDPQTYSRVNGFLKRRKDELIEEKIVFSINGMGTIGCPYAKDKNLKKKRF